MRILSTSAGRDAWLAALIDAFDSVSERRGEVSERTIADCENSLRTSTRANAAGSRLFH